MEKLTKEELHLILEIVEDRETELKEQSKTTQPFVGDFAERLLYMVTPLKEKLINIVGEN